RAEDVGQQRNERAHREADERRQRRRPRAGQLVRVDTQLLAGVYPDRLVRVAAHRERDLPGQFRVQAPVDPQLGQLPGPGVRVALQFQPLLGDLVGALFVLGTHRRVLAQAHRDRAGDQAGDAGEYDGVLVDPATAHSGDQGDVGDQAVHGPEYGRA